MAVYLGVDLGGTNIAAGLVSEDGELLHKDSVRTLSARGQGEVMKDLAELCRKIVADTKTSGKDLRSVGVGSPGACDSKNGVIVYNSNLHFDNAPVREEIQKVFDLPVYLNNDGNCAALGENICGATKGCKDSITITIGTGIGGGVVVNGKILAGAFNSGGEVGHHVIVNGGEPCSCGRLGCWEAYASATALIRDAKIAAVRDPHSAILSVVNNDFSAISGRTVFQAAARGDGTAKKVIDQYLRSVACGLANMINLFQPEKIAIGGGISGQGDVILNPIRKYVQAEVFGKVMRTEIVISHLGNDAGVIGAAMLGKR